MLLHLFAHLQKLSPSCPTCGNTVKETIMSPPSDGVIVYQCSCGTAFLPVLAASEGSDYRRRQEADQGSNDQGSND